MSSSRAPRWMYIIAASLLGSLATQVYAFFRGPETPLSLFNFRQGAMVVEEVLLNSAASRAGLQEGDRLVRRTAGWWE